MHEQMGDISPLIAPLTPGLELLASGIDLIGIAIVLWGFLRALVEFSKNEFERLRFATGVGGMQRVRINLGTYILVGVEFMIASDIIHTVVKRRLEDLAFVSALVAIRTAISFFLGREVAEASHEEHESSHKGMTKAV